MLIGLVFLIHSFGLVKVEGLSDSSRNLGYSPGHEVRVEKERYYEYRCDKNDPETNYITIGIFTKLELGSVLRDPRKIWTTGAVPFTVSKNCSKKQKKIILEAMKRLKTETCVRFIPRKNETTFITITPGRRCRTALSRKDTKQTMDEGCYDQGYIFDELMYVLDFAHEQNKFGDKKNFKTLRKGVHVYPRSDTSNINIAKINYMYGCNKKESIGSRNRINERPLEPSHEMRRSFRWKRNVETPGPPLYPEEITEYTEFTVDHERTDSDTSDSTDSSIAVETTENNEEATGTTVGKVGTSGQTNEIIDDSPVFSHSEEYHNVTIFGMIESRAILSYPSKLWSDGVIPYVISEKYDAIAKRLLLKGMDEFHNNTCVKFTEREDEITYIFIQPGSRCSAIIGKVEGGINNVTLGDGCFAPGTIVHELMHVIGFIHEQNRPDRDSYVKIEWDNIIPEAKSNFVKKEEGEVMDFGIGYDYESVMHYGKFDFAINFTIPTIVPLQPGVHIGQRDGFSKKDLMKINKLFKCNTEEDKDPKRDESLYLNFGKKFLEYVRNLFRAIYRALFRFYTNPNNTNI